MKFPNATTRTRRLWRVFEEFSIPKFRTLKILDPKLVRTCLNRTVEWVIDFPEEEIEKIRRNWPWVEDETPLKDFYYHSWKRLKRRRIRIHGNHENTKRNIRNTPFRATEEFKSKRKKMENVIQVTNMNILIANFLQNSSFHTTSMDLT